MDGRSLRTLMVGILIGVASSAVAVGMLLAAPGRGSAGVQGHGPVILNVRPVQDQAPVQSPFANPREFVPVPVPNNGNSVGPGLPSPGVGGNTPGSQQPSAGGGGQDCNGKVLFFYQGRLYQLSPGPTQNGGNPEFFYMQPYQGPQIPGFPEQTPSQGPLPGLPSIPPTFKF
jgi:hypothetical protein